MSVFLFLFIFSISGIEIPYNIIARPLAFFASIQDSIFTLMQHIGPQDSHGELDIKTETVPVTPPDNTFQSISPGLRVTVFDYRGERIDSFKKPLQITVDMNGTDYFRVDPGSIHVYSSLDGEHWKEEVTTVDFKQKKAIATLTRAGYVGLFGKRLDAIPANTTASVSGQLNKDGIYTSDVQVALLAVDNKGSLGIEYIAYDIGEGWKEYTSPFVVQRSGNYVLQFYSEDKDGNVENINTIKFSIDKQ